MDNPILAPAEMGSSWVEVVARLSADADLTASFGRVYGGGPTRERIRSALVAFERSLVTEGSRFDRYLAGDHGALNLEEQRGYALFLSYGCASCHQGMDAGGNMFQVFGVFGNWYQDRGRPQTDADQGRFNVTRREVDRHVFRVPSLRLAALTAPYLHDGSAATLDDAVLIMGHYEVGRDIPSEDRQAIVGFLTTLVGSLDVGEPHAP